MAGGGGCQACLSTSRAGGDGKDGEGGRTDRSHLQGFGRHLRLRRARLALSPGRPNQLGDCRGRCTGAKEPGWERTLAAGLASPLYRLLCSGLVRTLHSAKQNPEFTTQQQEDKQLRPNEQKV